MVLTLWSATKVGYNKDAENGIKHWGEKRYLEEIAVRRADHQVYKFKKGNFVDLHLNDIEDMLIIAVQHKLFQLNGSDIVDFDVPSFSNGTLNTIRDELHHRIFDFSLGYNKEMSRRKWTAIDKRRSELMVESIDKQMRERRIIRNLERLVGARQNQRDLPWDIPLDRIEVLRYSTEQNKDLKNKIVSKVEVKTNQSKLVTSCSTPKNKQEVACSSSVKRSEYKDTNAKKRVLLNTKYKSTSKDVKKSQSSFTSVSNKNDTMNSNVSESKANVLKVKIVNVVHGDPDCPLDIDSGYSKHMTGNLKLLRNFVKKFIGTVRFGNDNFAAITRYETFKGIPLYVTCTTLRASDIIFSRSDNFVMEILNSLCYSTNYRDDLGKMRPKADIEVLDNSTANTVDNEDTLSSSSIIVEDHDCDISYFQAKELKICSLGSTSGIRACCEALNKMEARTNSTTLTAKLPILNPGDYDLWLMRIEQYFLMTDYSLWEVIKNGNKVLKRTVGETEQEYEPTTAEEKQDRRNEMKARGTLLMALPNKDQLKFHSYKDAKLLMEAIEKRYGGNKESKKVQRTLLKQQYENFAGSSSETMDQTFDRLQKLITQLEIQGEVITQEDMNLKLLRSLPSEWKTHALIWRNKQEIETISLDDLYNNLKIYEPEISGSSSISQNPQNVAFVSSNNTNSNSSTNEADNTAYGVSAAHTQSNPTSGDNLSDAVICAFLASQPNSPQLSQEDLEQINPDDLEEMDLQWEMALLTIRAREIQSRGHRQEVGYRIRGYDWSYQDEEEHPTNFTLMAFTSSGSSSSSDSK
ncbi:hypothetical protein Tco_1237318, partial [Tanacetum coccineum]